MLRCREKAFTKCPYRRLCGPIESALFTEDSECAAFNREVEDKPITNADRIRSMSDSELVVLLKESFCDNRTQEECQISYCGMCDQCILDWLQEPAEEA